MDDALSPAAGTLAPGTDPAPEVSSTQAPVADADTGEGTQLDNDVNHDSSRAEEAATTETSAEAEAVAGAAAVTAETSEPAATPAPTATPAPAETSQPAETSAPAATPAPAEAVATPPRPSPKDSGDEITMEDVLAASDEQLARKPVHRGMITTGTIIMLAQDGIVVDVGAKIEGILPYGQLFEFETNAEEAAKYFKSGDEIQVYVVRSDVPNNTIVLSKKRADQERA